MDSSSLSTFRSPSDSSSSSPSSKTRPRLDAPRQRRKFRPQHRMKRRHPANMLHRQNHITAFNTLCAPFQTPDSRLRGKLQLLFEQERLDFSLSNSHVDSVKTPGALQATLSDDLELNRIDNGDLIEEAAEISVGKQSYEECRAPVEAGSEPDLFNQRQWSDLPASPLCYEGPNVTRAASEWSSVSDEYIHSSTWETNDWSIKDWKLHAELLMAECNLLREEKELAVQRLKHICVKMDEAVRMTQGLRAAVRSMPVERKADHEEMDEFTSLHCFQDEHQESLNKRLKKIESTLRSSELFRYSCFTREAAKKLKVQQNREHPHSRHNGADPLYETESVRRPISASAAVDERCLMDALALLKDFSLLELVESRAATSFIRKEFRSILNRAEHEAKDHFEKGSGEKQAIKEELYKAAIRKIADHVQAETEQWSQVQDILHHVQEDMNNLYESREAWEERALQAETQLLALQEQVHRWRCRAQIAETEVAFLLSERQSLKKQLEKAKYGLAVKQSRWMEHRESSLEEASIMSASSIRNKHGVYDEAEGEQELSPEKVITINKNGVNQDAEISRHSNAGTHDGYYYVRASVINRRKGSSESNGVVETCNSNFQKNINESLNFSKTDVHSKLKHEKQSPSDQIFKLETTKDLRTSDLKGEFRTENKDRERKTPKHLRLGENILRSTDDTQVTLTRVNQLQSGFNKSLVKYTDPFSSSKSKISQTVVMASRSPFGDIMNTNAFATVKYHPFQQS